MEPDHHDDEGEESLGEKIKFQLLDAAEEMSDDRPQTWWSRLAAWLAPLLGAVLGIRIIVLQRATVWQRPGFGPHTVTGPAATVVGSVVLLLGLLFHFKAFWYRRHPLVGALGMVATFFAIVVLLFVFAVMLIRQPSLLAR